MRQVIGFAQAIRKRKSRDYYEQLCLQASVAGRKVTSTFEEMFPDYEEDLNQVALDPETVSIMDKLAQSQLAELERKWRQTNS